MLVQRPKTMFSLPREAVSLLWSSVSSGGLGTGVGQLAFETEWLTISVENRTQGFEPWRPPCQPVF